jgi:hypothetical protein
MLRQRTLRAARETRSGKPRRRRCGQRPSNSVGCLVAHEAIVFASTPAVFRAVERFAERHVSGLIVK